MGSKLQLLFEDFQGRELRRTQTRSIEKRLPKKLYAFGTAKSVLYYCDKRDPGDPVGEGAQGYWKLFIHEHDPGVVLYCSKGDLEAGSGWGKPLSPRYPRSCAWLGELEEIEYIDEDGRLEKEEFDGYDLWVWDDHKTMWALPKDGSLDSIIVWSGGRLKVTKYGIEH